MSSMLLLAYRQRLRGCRRHPPPGRLATQFAGGALPSDITVPARPGAAPGTAEIYLV